MKNFWKMEESFGKHFSYAYIDLNNYFADEIFLEKNIEVKFLREMIRGDSPYRIVICKIKREDGEAFEEALKLLEDKMLLLGHSDYLAVCAELETQLEEG
jgi:hypothetical protein